MKLMTEYDYEIRVSEAGIAEFSAENSPYMELRFWVTTEA
jgi:hypothetical protein